MSVLNIYVRIERSRWCRVQYRSLCDYLFHKWLYSFFWIKECVPSDCEHEVQVLRVEICSFETYFAKNLSLWRLRLPANTYRVALDLVTSVINWVIVILGLSIFKLWVEINNYLIFVYNLNLCRFFRIWGISSSSFSSDILH